MGLFGCATEGNSKELEFKKLKNNCNTALKGLQKVVKHNHYGEDLHILLFQAADALKEIKEFFEPFFNEETFETLQVDTDSQIQKLTDEKNELENKLAALQTKGAKQHEDLEQLKNVSAILEASLKTQDQAYEKLQHANFYQKEYDVITRLNSNQEHERLQGSFLEFHAFEDIHQQNSVFQKQCLGFNELQQKLENQPTVSMHYNTETVSTTKLFNELQHKSLDSDIVTQQLTNQNLKVIEKAKKNTSENDTDLEKLNQKLTKLVNDNFQLQQDYQNIEKYNHMLKQENEKLIHANVQAKKNFLTNIQNCIHSHQEIIASLRSVNKTLDHNQLQPIITNTSPKPIPTSSLTPAIASNEFNKLLIIKHIEDINNDIKIISKKIDSFGISSNTSKYLEMQESIIRSMLQLDNIQSCGDQTVRLQRMKSMKAAQDLLKNLETVFSE